MAVLYSIPLNFADAFHEATLRYLYWERGEPEPSLTLQGRRRPISDACKIAMEFDDRIPWCAVSLSARYSVSFQEAGAKHHDPEPTSQLRDLVWKKRPRHTAGWAAKRIAERFRLPVL